ncbi:hypothetical protein U9M48_024438 [Paspalum notatum var. saurae]|uniref:Integrase catalytic domain-containing protein n=1 Tax=Paspalum notatum var. saurae TaxID=547442 RepID=A0AAQ3TR02_PASNO
MEDVWIMDSGCSRHMTGHRKWFSSLNPVSTKEYITFGDNGQGKVMGVGSVSLSAKLSLREIAFVRNLGFNLVSVSQLLDEGFEVFRVDLISVSSPARCLVASPSADIWKWHRRLGHLSFDLLVRLSSMGLIRGLPKLRAEKDLVCHSCRHGKMVAASHIPVSQVMTSYPSELLHMDTVGPDRVASVSGKWYVLVVVDDFLRFSWVFFMEFKDEGFGFVRDLVLRLRNESHKAMRAIRSDNGGEFRNSRFENFCRDLGLEHQFSSPYTPPQNGVVERKNRTLVEMARTMLDEHRTPRRFWAEAVNTACYIANRIFLRAFLGKTSYELRFGRQPSVKHLRAFGCRCFVLKKAGHLDKFESRCLDGIFLGYASNSRAFRVWILEAKQVVETCEVSFDETMPYTTPAFELLGDDEEGTPIFEDEEGVVNDGDAGATAPTAAPAPSATSSDDEGGPLPTASSSLPRQQAQAEAGSTEDAGEQMDVKSAFLNGFIEEEVYVRQPPSFESARFSDRVYKLRKALYGLKQAPRAWYARLKNFLLKSGLVMGSVDKTLFLLSRGGDTLIVQIYIDDIIFGGSSHALVSSFAEQMSREFKMSLMGELQFFLGLQIKQGLEGTFVHQAKYTRDILKKFNMGDSKPMTTPMSTNTALDADEDGEAVDQKKFRGMIGSLLYLTATRPDIQFAVCLCARYQASPRTSHRQAVKRIFRYLKFTPELGLWYCSGSSLSLRGFSDADHAGCRIDHKSTSSTCQFLGTSLVSWSSRKQASVALSTTEAEYVAATSCCSQLLWMKATLSDFGLRFGRIPLLVDSTSAISVAKNPVLHSRTKHIDVRFHFLRDHYEKGDIDLIHVVSANQLADIFAKPLEFDAFTRLRGYLDTKPIEPLSGTRVLITQTRKAGTIELSYASMTTYPDDGVEYTGFRIGDVAGFSGSTTAAPGSGSTPSLSEQNETRTIDIKASPWNHVTILEKANLVEEMFYGDATIVRSRKAVATLGWNVAAKEREGDPRRRPIINFIVVSEKAPIFLRADNCEGQIKTKEYIAKKLRGVIDEVDSQNVVQIMLPIAKPKVPREPSDEELFVWNQLEFVHNVKSDATMIKNFIMNHGMRLSMFNEFSHLKLLSIAETRFASVVCMLKRFVEIKTALQHMVISDKWSIYKDDAPTVQVVKEKILSDVWWSNVEYILRITNPIYEMIHLADTDTPCLHLIYEMWDSMIERVKKEIYQYEGKELDEV